MERIYEILRQHNIYPVQGVRKKPYDINIQSSQMGIDMHDPIIVEDYIKYITLDSIVINLRRRPDNNVSVHIYDMKVPCTLFNRTLSENEAIEQLFKYFNI